MSCWKLGMRNRIIGIIFWQLITFHLILKPAYVLLRKVEKALIPYSLISKVYFLNLLNMRRFNALNLAQLWDSKTKNLTSICNTKKISSFFTPKAPMHSKFNFHKVRNSRIYQYLFLVNLFNFHIYQLKLKPDA